MTFHERALRVVRRIPRGQVMTYSEVARAAGNHRAARAVGAMMRANHKAAVPCHRVVRSDLRPGEYNRPGGTATKIRRLRREGVAFSDGRIARRRI